MYIIAGLGNPGKKYENTRHNLGFITVDRLADKDGVSVTRKKFDALVGEDNIGGEKVLLMKPQTYMNESGRAIAQAVKFYKVDLSHLIVIYDDFDIKEGSIRIRKFGSAGTHNGMRSIVSCLGSDRFPRLRVGTGVENKGDIVDFVLGGFSKSEKSMMEQAVDTAVDALRCYVTEDIDKAMNIYNSKRSGGNK
ncbi:MAG: aminoacyl-tRNA hydrolase [Eubacteriales bacterium]|nr:aminoacyl-tRNA hydrolase [Eubacteriales bacterium]